MSSVFLKRYTNIRKKSTICTTMSSPSMYLS